MRDRERGRERGRERKERERREEGERKRVQVMFMTATGFALPSGNPNCRHTTPASAASQLSLHTVPQVLLK